MGGRGGWKRKDAALGTPQNQADTGPGSAGWVASPGCPPLRVPRWKPPHPGRSGDRAWAARQHLAQAGSAPEVGSRPRGRQTPPSGGRGTLPGPRRAAGLSGSSLRAGCSDPGSRAAALSSQNGDRACGCSPGAEASEQPGLWAPPRPGEWLPSRQEEGRAGWLRRPLPRCPEKPCWGAGGRGGAGR